MSTNKVGAVMVVGGGIAGMQASLDLADSGYYVYLVEGSSSIGGMMSYLAQTGRGRPAHQHRTSHPCRSSKHQW
jgi:heterodisulfide reductase subunit A